MNEQFEFTYIFKGLPLVPNSFKLRCLFYFRPRRITFEKRLDAITNLDFPRTIDPS